MRKQRWMGWTLLALAGCASGGRSVADLEAQVRALRSEQDQQARRISQLEGRIALAEDTVRTASRAAGVIQRGTVHIVDEGQRAPLQSAVESIPSALHEDAPESDPQGGEDPSRPVVRAQGRPPLAPPGTPIVVREDDRLPVAPVPPPPEDRANPNANPTVRPANSPAVAPTRDPGRGPSALGPEAGAEPLPALAHTPLGGTSSARDPRSTAAYEAALADARGGQCARAVDAFAAFLVRWPDHPHAASALYWRGECVLAGGDARRAAEQFEAALARSTTSHLSASAVFKLAQCHRRLGDAARARSYSERLQREFAATEPAARARAEEIR